MVSCRIKFNGEEITMDKYEELRTLIEEVIESGEYHLEIRKDRPNDNMWSFWIGKMYDEDFEPIYIGNTWGDQGLKLMKIAPTKVVEQELKDE